MNLAHGTRSEAWMWAVGSVCNCCVFDFGNPARLATHFKRRPRCLQALKAYFREPPPHPEGQLAEVAARRACLKREGRNVGYADVPAVRIPGPGIKPIVLSLPRSSSPRAMQAQHGGEDLQEAEVIAVEDSD